MKIQMNEFYDVGIYDIGCIWMSCFFLKDVVGFF
jgi:hypothetical protein